MDVPKKETRGDNTAVRQTKRGKSSSSDDEGKDHHTAKRRRNKRSPTPSDSSSESSSSKSSESDSSEFNKKVRRIVEQQVIDSQLRKYGNILMPAVKDDRVNFTEPISEQQFLTRLRNHYKDSNFNFVKFPKMFDNKHAELARHRREALDYAMRLATAHDMIIYVGGMVAREIPLDGKIVLYINPVQTIADQINVSTIHQLNKHGVYVR